MDKISELDRRTIRMATESLQARYHPREKAVEGMIHLIKYPNRRLYSQYHHRYTTVAEVAKWWLSGTRITAEAPGGRDITVPLILEALAMLQGWGAVKLTIEQLRALSPAVTP